MTRARRPLLLLLPVLLAAGCRQSQPSSRDAAQGNAGDGNLRVVFPLPGDDIGSPESAATLERVAAAVEERGAGEVVGSGFGMGWMELLVRPRGEGPPASLEAILRKECPAARWRIEKAAP